MLTRAAVSLCVADATAIARRRRSESKQQQDRKADVHRLSITELLGLLRRDWQPFCIGSVSGAIFQASLVLLSLLAFAFARCPSRRHNQPTDLLWNCPCFVVAVARVSALAAL